MKKLIKCTTCKLIHTVEDRCDKLNKKESNQYVQWHDNVCPKCEGKSYQKTKPKCYVIMVARNFLKSHSRSGEPTFFIEKIAEGIKKHTVRGNYELWKERVEKILKAEAYISLRYWSGKPFVSKQVEFRQLHAADGVGIQAVEKRSDRMIWHYTEDVHLFDFVPLKPIGNNNIDLAKNDGLALEDLQEWFKKAKINEPLALIYFTPFRY